jgi:hypothetical protein
MPAKYRALAPHTTTLPDGSDAIVMEGSGPFRVNYIDLRGGRKAEDWQPVGVKVENTPGIGPPEQRVEEQDVDGLLAEVLFPNMAAGPGLWRNMQDDAAYKGGGPGLQRLVGRRVLPSGAGPPHRHGGHPVD